MALLLSLQEKDIILDVLGRAGHPITNIHGVDLSVIALWLGHESSETTQIYLHADMGLKERALAHTQSSGIIPERYKPADPLLTFLESL